MWLDSDCVLYAQTVLINGLIHLTYYVDSRALLVRGTASVQMLFCFQLSGRQSTWI